MEKQSGNERVKDFFSIVDWEKIEAFKVDVDATDLNQWRSFIYTNKNNNVKYCGRRKVWCGNVCFLLTRYDQILMHILVLSSNVFLHTI